MRCMASKLIALGMLLFCIITSAATAVEASNQKPNIIFILADDMNRDTWGVYGSKDCKTPNIDRLASDGVRFDRAYTAASMCAPFRQELYSGRSPWRTGAMPNHSQSKPGTKSIPHYLKPLGYRVALVGKTHIGPKPCYPFEYFPQGDKSKDNNELYLKTARIMMDDSARTGKPFCLFVASNDGHGPYTTGDPSAYDPKTLTIPPYWLDTPELRRALPKWYAEITNFDKLVGDVRAELEKRKLWDNTIVMVCSEQGTSYPFAKWTCYDNGLHTGLVAHWGNKTKPGHIAKGLISMADVVPTLVEAAGGKLKPNDCDGKSFLPMLKGQEQTINKYVYGTFVNCNINGNLTRIFPIRSIRSTSYSLLYNPNHESTTCNPTLNSALAMLGDPTKEATGIAPSWVKLSRKDPKAKPLVHKLHHRPEYEFYDLGNDPYELKNEIHNPKYAEAVKELKNALHTYLKKNGDADPIATEKKQVKPRHGGGKKKKKEKK
jgi:N-sulfoglucosamine sulfohydrolase